MSVLWREGMINLSSTKEGLPGKEALLERSYDHDYRSQKIEIQKFYQETEYRCQRAKYSEYSERLFRVRGSYLKENQQQVAATLTTPTIRS